ncbi:transcription-repair coupling factor [Desulfoglaeba alkanexedens]|uniref:Transcription-repair-coupling factor n=1 Tax=Desulfoglaeba alkanexedens ALDC TaxID=980445 RepID=A0A4P8L3X7_9BACT|nr:transcription-repair coupling factor [Desulfoglaeba alkanexedens]QCQ22423.1 transcription-repair coupling factor [Desulfoglaeba alkanexedens ALDC]
MEPATETVVRPGRAASDVPSATLEDVRAFLRSSSESLAVSGFPSSAAAYLVSRILDLASRHMVVVTATDREAEQLADEIRFFLGKKRLKPDVPLERRVWTLPSRSGHKAQVLGKAEAIARRMEALYALRNAPRPSVVVTSALALIERVVPPEVLLRHAECRVAGEEIPLEAFRRRLVERGYYNVSLVEEYGDLSLRGGVLDIFAPLYGWPLRLEFFGDQLESIRLFHPSSQRSLATMEDAILLPASEIVLEAAGRERAERALMEDIQRGRLTPAAGSAWLEKLQEGHQLAAFEPVLPVFYGELGSLFDYLDPQSLLVWTDAAALQKEMHEAYQRVLWEWDRSRTEQDWRRPPEELFVEPEMVLERAETVREIRINALSGEGGGGRLNLAVSGQDDLLAAVKSHRSRERLLEPLSQQIKRWQDRDIRTVLVCGQKEQGARLASLLSDYGLEARPQPAAAIRDGFDAGTTAVVVGPLHRGFFWPSEKLSVVSEEEIFGRRRPRRRAKASVAGIFLSSFQDLHAGDFVVHVDHGIGVYKGLMHLQVGGVEGDFLHLEYQDGDRLYVPVDKLQKIQKYLGIEGEDPRVDKLGGKSWEAAKKKARESACRVAEELLKLYAMRQVREGIRFSPPDSLYREFEATFAYEETADQIRAIEEVLEDMCSQKTMDRLICGDVGYGKTEVAIRAAFKAVMDGKQVAMLVPTTVLAEQHYQTFKERFNGFPVRVEVLSRFKTAAQQRQVLDGLKAGAVDVVVGTHRLLQKDVQFRELGLLIIDEEQRFGVKHKERLKQLRVSVDVLTLTATPIPRTLHMALTGIRDLSTIETPPEDRKAVETAVCTYDEFTIREAIHRELQRGGQVFFVHNHVQSILQVANRLRKLVPEARIGVAHGQMKERDLEKVMFEFIGRELDVLVCTTIIESGLDIPAANTIIINRADKMGLAQIYQLRGRVGRSSEQAYAYLLIPGEHLVTRDAQKRLRALMDFSELGSGFKIALNDLQIRGGGAILGAAQSGHISAVGYELYLELLEKTVRQLKGEPVEEEAFDPEITVPVSAFLPEAYVPDTDQRLLAYKRLAGVSEEGDVDDLAREWRDRFGPLPDSAKALALLAKIRLLLQRRRVARLEGDLQTYTLHFLEPIDFEKMSRVLADEKCFARMEGPRKLILEMAGRGALGHLARLKRILQAFGEHGSDIKSIQ